MVPPAVLLGMRREARKRNESVDFGVAVLG
jgi:hypothetical protein